MARRGLRSQLVLMSMVDSHSEYPETRAEALQQGDLVPNQDFRGVYSTILEDWMKLDAPSVVNGTFERPAFINTNGNGH